MKTSERRVDSNEVTATVLQSIKCVLNEVQNAASRELALPMLRRLAWKIGELSEGLKSHGTFRLVINEHDWNYLYRLPSLIHHLDDMQWRSFLEDLPNFITYLDDLIVLQKQKNPRQFLKEIKEGDLNHLYDRPETRLLSIASALAPHLDREWVGRIQAQVAMVVANSEATGHYEKIAVFRSVEVIGEYLKRLIHKPEGLPDLGVLRDKIAHLNPKAYAFIDDYDICPLLKDLKTLEALLDGDASTSDFPAIQLLIQSFPKASSNKSPVANTFETVCTKKLEAIMERAAAKKILKSALTITKQAKSRNKDITVEELQDCCKRIGEQVSSKGFLLQCLCKELLPVIKKDSYPDFPALSHFFEEKGMSPIPVIAALQNASVRVSRTEHRPFDGSDLPKLKLGKLTSYLSEVDFSSILHAFIPKGFANQDQMVKSILEENAASSLSSFMRELDELLDPIDYAIDSMGGDIHYDRIFELTAPVCLYLQKKLQELGDIAGILIQNQMLLSTLARIDVAAIKYKRLLRLFLLRNTLSHSFHQLSQVEMQAIVLSLILQARRESKKASDFLDKGDLSLEAVISDLAFGGSSRDEPIIDREFIDDQGVVIMAASKRYGLEKEVYALNLGRDKIGSSRGLHLYVSFNKELESGLNEQYLDRKLRLHLFSRDLGELLNCQVIVETDLSLGEKKRDGLLSEDNVNQLSPRGHLKGTHFIDISVLQKEQHYVRAFQDDRVFRFILPGGVIVEKNSDLFTEEKVADAVFIYSFPSEEDYHLDRNHQIARRRVLVEEPRVCQDMEEKARKIKRSLQQIQPMFLESKWKHFFSLDIELDKLLGEHFDANFPAITQAWVRSSVTSWFPLSKRNFIRYVKRHHNLDLIVDSQCKERVHGLLVEWVQAFKALIPCYARLPLNDDLAEDLMCSGDRQAYKEVYDEMEQMFDLRLYLPSSLLVSCRVPYEEIDSLPEEIKKNITLCYRIFLKYKCINFITSYLGINWDASKLEIQAALKRVFIESNEVGGDTVSFMTKVTHLRPLSYDFRERGAPASLDAMHMKCLTITHTIRALSDHLKYLSERKEVGNKKMKPIEGDSSSYQSLDEVFELVIKDPAFSCSQTLRPEGMFVLRPSDKPDALFDLLESYGIPKEDHKQYGGNLALDNYYLSVILKCHYFEDKLVALRARATYLRSSLEWLKQSFDQETSSVAKHLNEYEQGRIHSQITLLQSVEKQWVVSVSKAKRMFERAPLSHARFSWFSGACRVEESREHGFDRPGPTGFV